MQYRIDLLIAARDRQLLKNHEIARKIGRSESAVSKTLSGERSGKSTIKKMARFLGVPIEQLAVEPETGNGRKTA